jgi:hypothetical protein
MSLKNTNTSYVVSKQQCPRCAAKGNDTSKNNLIIYSDGGQFCYSCNKVLKLSSTYIREHGLQEIEIKNERRV